MHPNLIVMYLTISTGEYILILIIVLLIILLTIAAIIIYHQSKELEMQVRGENEPLNDFSERILSRYEQVYKNRNK